MLSFFKTRIQCFNIPPKNHFRKYFQYFLFGSCLICRIFLPVTFICLYSKVFFLLRHIMIRASVTFCSWVHSTYLTLIYLFSVSSNTLGLNQLLRFVRQRLNDISFCPPFIRNCPPRYLSSCTSLCQYNSIFDSRYQLACLAIKIQILTIYVFVTLV